MNTQTEKRPIEFRNIQPERRPIEFKINRHAYPWEYTPVEYTAVLTPAEAEARAKAYANEQLAVTRWNYVGSSQGHYVHPDDFYALPEKGTQNMNTQNTQAETIAEHLNEALERYNRATWKEATIYKTPGGFWHITAPDFTFLFSAGTRRELTALVNAYLNGYRDGKAKERLYYTEALAKADEEVATLWAKYRTPESTAEDRETYEEAALNRNYLRDLLEARN